MPYVLKPEVAGGWGNGTIADTSCHPPKVSLLVYEFESWSEDDLLTTFPCFIVSSRLAAQIEAASLTGFVLAPVAVTKSDLFEELHPDLELPAFMWLKVVGELEKADFAINQKHRLTVSDKAFEIIRKTNISGCEVLPC